MTNQEYLIPNLKMIPKFTYDYLQENKHFLLMPNEVLLIKNYLSIFPEKNLKDAFYWFTGSDKKDVENVKLIIEYI